MSAAARRPRLRPAIAVGAVTVAIGVAIATHGGDHREPDDRVSVTVPAGAVTAAPAQDESVDTGVEVLGAIELPSTTTAAVELAPASSLAPTPVVGSGPPGVLPPHHELVGQAALDVLSASFDPVERLPGWQIDFLPGREGLRGLTLPDERRIEIYVRGGDDISGTARVLAHELGHASDISFNDDADRAVWRAVRGVDDHVAWWPTGTTYDFDTLAGDFAEAFATWLTGSDSVSRVAGSVTAEQLDVLAGLVA